MEAAARRNFYLALFAIGIFPFMVNGYVNSLTFRIPLLYWSFEIVSWVVVPILVFVTAVRRGGLRFSDIGLNSAVFGRRNYGLLVLICIAFGPLELYIYRNAYDFLRTVFPGTPFFSYESVVPESGFLRMIVAIYLSLTAGIVEELYFRGLFFKVSTFFPRPPVVYLSASPLLFALIHWEGGASNVIAAYVLGLFGAAAFLAMRNLWPLIVGHVYTDYVWFS